jgi:hypothetical protein
VYPGPPLTLNLCERIRVMATVISVNRASKGKNGKVPTAADLLKSATKSPTASKHGGYDFDGGLQTLASKVLELIGVKAETERELDLAKDQVRQNVDPWYQERLLSNGYESSVRIPAGSKGVLRLSYQHRYLKLPAEKESALRQIVGERYEDYFQPAASVKIRKDIADDPERLAQVVVRLGQVLGDEFAAIFEAEQTILPTKRFTEQRYRELDKQTNAALNLAGVYQVVSFGEGR